MRVVKKRCARCHNKKVKRPIPDSIRNEIGISFWRFDIDDPRLKFSRHLVFDLSRPEKSMMPLAPLSKKDGKREWVYNGCAYRKVHPGLI
jgi:hypothetical protein